MAKSALPWKLHYQLWGCWKAKSKKRKKRGEPPRLQDKVSSQKTARTVVVSGSACTWLPVSNSYIFCLYSSWDFNPWAACCAQKPDEKCGTLGGGVKEQGSRKMESESLAESGETFAIFSATNSFWSISLLDCESRNLVRRMGFRLPLSAFPLVFHTVLQQTQIQASLEWTFSQLEA